MDASHITSRFGWREHPILGYSALHTGVDFAAPQGTPVLAAGAGKVKMAGYNGGYGLFVRLDHTQQEQARQYAGPLLRGREAIGAGEAPATSTASRAFGTTTSPTDTRKGESPRTSISRLAGR